MHVSMDDFLSFLEKRLHSPWVQYAPSNFPRYADPWTGQVLVDRIIRYENLNTELAEVFQELGVEFSGAINHRAKGSFRASRAPYQELLNPEQKKRIARLFSWEIELMGYSMD